MSDANFINTYNEVILENLNAIMKQNFMFQTQIKFFEQRVNDIPEMEKKLADFEKNKSVELKELVNTTGDFERRLSETSAGFEKKLSEKLSNTFCTGISNMETLFKFNSLAFWITLATPLIKGSIPIKWFFGYLVAWNNKFSPKPNPISKTKSLCLTNLICSKSTKKSSLWFV